MDITQFDELNAKLRDVQYHKSKGLITTPLFEKFVRFVEATEDKLKGLDFYEPPKFAIRVTLAPQTTQKDYYTIDPVVGYCGPYTAVHYENGEYRFERIEFDRDWYQAVREYDQGTRLEIEFTGPAFVVLEDLMNITDGKANLRHSYVSSRKDGALAFIFLIPIERIT